MDDTLLLRQFAADRSDAAFARIVDRYGGLIYAAAKRHVGQTQLAEDVTQATFWTLACKADSIPPERSLAAWLLTTTRFIALNARRKQARIAKHEVAVSLHTGGTVDLSIWGPLLDEGLQRLSPADRDVLVWRFFESHPLAEVGRRANVSEEAARKRVTRALSRLREFFHRRGVTVSDLGASLAALSLPPPPGLLLTADAPPQVVALSKGGMTLMAASKLKTVIVMAAFLMAVGLPVVGWYVVSSRSAPPRMASTAPAASPVAGALPAAVAPEPFPAVTFDDGTHVRLSNVRRYYQPQRPWAADGSPAMDDIAVIQHGVPDEDKADAAKVLEVRLEFKGELSGKGYALRLGGTYNWTTHNDPAGWPNRLLFSTLFRLPKDEEEAELQIGLAWQPWEDTEVLAVEDAPARALAAAPFRTSGWGRPSTSQPAGTEPMHILSITEEAGKTLVEYTNPHGWPQGDWRGRDKQYMIRTRDGRIVKWRTVNYPDGRMIFVYDLPLSEIEAAVYQTRAYEWKSLGRVKLQAKSE